MKLFDLSKILFVSTCFVILLLASGCNTVETGNGTVTVSLSSPVTSPKITDNTITLDTVKILLRDIKLKNQGTSDEMNIKVGPFVIYLDLGGITTDFAVGEIPPGTYNRIKFKVHTLEDSEIPPDPEFKEDSLRYSVIVKGLFNSVPFIYKSKKPAHQDLKLDTPVTVEESGTANLTIMVDPSAWFVVNGNVVDPNDPSYENDIDNNIKDSFKRCFKDNDHNGQGD
jgi:hypothetical protein